MADAITLKKSSGGVLLKNAAGVLVKECSGGCEFCDGSTPETLEVVFSGVMGCCVPGSPFVRTAINTAFAAATLNNPGGITLTRTGEGSCVWHYSQSSVGYGVYSETYTCDTWTANSYTAVLTITLTKTSDSTWTLTVEFDTTLVPYSGFMFDDTISGQAAGCTGGLSFTNDLTACSGLAHGNAGYNGSASVSVP